jgi:hypothetical protein
LAQRHVAFGERTRLFTQQDAGGYARLAPARVVPCLALIRHDYWILEKWRAVKLKGAAEKITVCTPDEFTIT